MDNRVDWHLREIVQKLSYDKRGNPCNIQRDGVSRDGLRDFSGKQFYESYIQPIDPFWRLKISNICDCMNRWYDKLFGIENLKVFFSEESFPHFGNEIWCLVYRSLLLY